MWVVHMVQVFRLNSADVLWMSMVHGMRGVGGVCERCMCLARGGVGGDEWMRGLGLALPIMWEQGKCWTCVCVFVALVWVVSGYGAWTRVWRGGVVCVVSLDYLCRWQAHVFMYCA